MNPMMLVDNNASEERHRRASRYFQLIARETYLEAIFNRNRPTRFEDIAKYQKMRNWMYWTLPWLRIMKHNSKVGIVTKSR